MNDTEMKVSVSGTTVYKAVANYLKNSEELKEHIRTAVSKALESGSLEQAVLRQVEREIQKYYYAKTLEKDIDKVIKRQVEERIREQLPKKELLAMIKKTVSGMLV
jgi:hypothetical protein